MYGWWILVGLVAAGLALTPRTVRRHTRRVQVARVRAELAAWLSAPQQPASVFVPPTRGTDRCSHTAMLGDAHPSIAVSPVGEAS